MYTVKGIIPNKGILVAHARTQEDAFALAGEAMEAGACTVVISPPKVPTLALVALGQVAFAGTKAEAPRARLTVVDTDQ